MEEFDFNETEMSTSIEKLRKKKTELDDENNNKMNNLNYENENSNYKDIMKNLNNEIKNNHYNRDRNYNRNHHNSDRHNRNKIKQSKNNDFYKNLIVFSVIFFIVNHHKLYNFLLYKRFSYYTIVFI